MTATPIKTVTHDDQQRAIAVLVLAFGADPVMRWGQPDPHKYLTHFPEFIRAFAGKTFECGTGYYLEGFSGAALWLPPDVQPDEEEMMPLLQRTVPEVLQDDVFTMLEQMGESHPNEPHWYLAMIGVEPRHQRQGLGSALMRRGLVPCDRGKKVAYLEASSPENSVWKNSRNTRNSPSASTFVSHQAAW